MRATLHIIDDFLPNPMEIRNEVIAQGFTDATFEGDPYYTVNYAFRPHEIHQQLNLYFNTPVNVHVQAFRQGKKGSHIHNFVHADNTCATFAGVLFLNLPEHCQGGTAFWRHRETGWDRQPTADQLQDVGRTVEDFAKDWQSVDKWELVTLAGMKFNRMIIYPSSMFHSRYPFDGFGQTDEDARLIHAIFFDI